MNELIDLIAMQDINPTDGLNDIKFSHLSMSVGDLDEGVLDRLIEFSKKLNKLTVSSINSKENRKALFIMSEKILNLAPPLTHLDFSSLFGSNRSNRSNDSEDILQKG